MMNVLLMRWSHPSLCCIFCFASHCFALLCPVLGFDGYSMGQDCTGGGEELLAVSAGLMCVSVQGASRC